MSDTEWEDFATVRVEKIYHVRIKARGPHPDLADWEAASMALDRRIEQEGDVPADVEVTYASLTSETEPWAVTHR